MGMKKASILILLLLLPSIIMARGVDTSYIEQFEQELLTKFSLNNKTEEFRLNSFDRTMILRPNSLNKLSVHFSHQFLTVGFSLSPSFLPGNDNDDVKGESTIYDFSTTLKFDHWMQDLSFSYVKGFYLVNSDDIDDNGENTDAYIQFPELTYIKFSGYTAYKANPKFSFKAITSQTERQRKSAGSFIPLVYYKYYIMDNKEKLTEDNQSSQKSNNFEMSAQVGYYYTKVMSKKWYIAPGVTAGGGFIHTRLTTRFTDDRIKNNFTNPIFRATGSFSIGYMSRKWAFGANGVGAFEHFPEGNSTSITNNHVYTEVYITYRFNTPKIVKETVDMIPMPIK